LRFEEEKYLPVEYKGVQVDIVEKAKKLRVLRASVVMVHT